MLTHKNTQTLEIDQQSQTLARAAADIMIDAASDTESILIAGARSLSAAPVPTRGLLALIVHENGWRIACAATSEGVVDPSDPAILGLLAQSGVTPPCVFAGPTDPGDARSSPMDERARRASLGLYEFVRAVLIVPDSAETARIVVDVAGRTKDWRPSRADASMCLSIAHLTALAIQRRVTRRDQARDHLLERLTLAQRIVARRLIMEVPEPQIAAALRRSEYTIHDHVKGIFRAWDVHSKAEALWLWHDPLHARFRKNPRADPTVRVCTTGETQPSTR